MPGSTPPTAVCAWRWADEATEAARVAGKGRRRVKVMGMISGTSRDGIDVAVLDLELVVDPAVDADARPGLIGRVLATATVDYPPELSDALEHAAIEPTTTWLDVCRLDAAIGRAFAAAAASVAASTGPIDAVCSHGQTLFHWVEDGRTRGTLQLGNSAWIAEELGVPVVADTRSRDVAAGGQGAPLVPVLDLLVLAGTGRRTAALNLGGIANITLPEDGVAYDTGPANSLLDTAVRRRRAHPSGYDAGGAIAATGRVDDDLLARMLAHPYFAAEPPKSTGPETFGPVWLDRVLAAAPGISTPDLLATLTALTASSVAGELRRWKVERVLASGGGVHNAHLMRRLRHELPDVDIDLSDAVGLPCDAKEAIAFALIGWLTMHGLPANLPSCTGARGPRLLGVLAPGTGAFEVRRLDVEPAWLRMH